MYFNQPAIPPGRRPPKPTKDHATTRPGQPVALSRGLHQGLQQKLYKGLHQGFQARAHHATGTPKSALRAHVETDAGIPSEPELPTSATKIRRVSLLSGEMVTHTFCPEKGLIPHPQEHGRMLVLTNQRVIAFGQRDGMNQTVLMPVEEVKAVAVNSGRRSKAMLFRGGLIMLAGIVIYVLLAYWLEGRIDGPTIPIIRMGLVAFLVFLTILSIVGIMSQLYFSKPDGEATFQGDGVNLAFPFRGETAEDHIYDVVNAAFAARQSIIGQHEMAYARLSVK